MEEYTEDIEDSGADLVQLQDFSYREIRKLNPQLQGISKREYMNNKELQEKTQGIRLDGKTILDDFEFDDNLTIGQEFNIERNEVNEPMPIDDSEYDYNINNEFAEGGYTDNQIDPKKKNNPATRQDSLNVYNSAIKFKDKINKLGYKRVYEKKYDPSDDVYKYNNDGKITLNTDDKDLMHDLNLYTNKRKNGDVYLNSNVDRTGGKKIKQKEGDLTLKNKRFPAVGHNVPMLKKISENQYLTSEQSAFIGYNTDIPNLLMDGRIKPQTKSRYNLKDTVERDGDFVIFNEYDPLAVKPFNMLNENEKKERVKKYGKDGVPESYYKKENNKKEIKNSVPKANPKLDPMSLSMADLVFDNEIKSNAKIRETKRIPKSYKVTEIEKAPYGLDDRINGENITTYEVSDPRNIDTRKINGTRKIQEQYAEGGKIDPPVRTYGLTPEQKKEAEDEALFVNNWNANRVVNGTKLENGYQIPASQKVGLKSLNSKNKKDSVRMAEYNPNTDSIALNRDSYETGRGFTAHEYSHRFQKYTKRLSPDIYNNYISSPISEVINNDGTYNTDPEEIHSELMRLRNNQKFRPDQVINENDVNFDYNDEYNLNNISREDLIKLLNSTAYNDYNSSVNMASHGGKVNGNGERLTKFESGGTHQENKLGGIPIGMGNNGKMNTVEEGETRYSFDDGDYIFSNRINTKGLLRDFK